MLSVEYSPLLNIKKIDVADLESHQGITFILYGRSAIQPLCLFDVYLFVCCCCVVVFFVCVCVLFCFLFFFFGGGGANIICVLYFLQMSNIYCVFVSFFPLKW